jgi:DNA-binding response OmpR family regulator
VAQLHELEALRTRNGATPRLRVLIIGSHSPSVSRIGLFLSLAGHYPTTVKGGPVDICRALDSSPHAIVLVIGSIGLSGVQIAKTIRDYAAVNLRRRVSVIAATEVAADKVRLGLRIDHFVTAADTPDLPNLIARLAPSAIGKPN